MESQNVDTDGLNENERKKNKSDSKKSRKMASLGQTMSFVWQCGGQIRFLWFVGLVAAVLNGLVYPIIAYLFSTSFSDLSAASSNGLARIRELAYKFMVVGSYALVCATVQGWSFTIVGNSGSQNFRLQWFHALLRQDPSYFDAHDIGGLAAQVGPCSQRYERGISRRMGEGIQFFTTGVGGIAFAFYSSWRVALVILCVIPMVSVASMATLHFNQSKGKRAAQSYKTAGTVAYSAVAAIRTVLSLNAVPEMIRRYKVATAESFAIATSFLIRVGFSNGSMIGSFLLLYVVLTLYGSSLLYNDVEHTGCDPSAGVSGNSPCETTAPGVFGAMMGVAFAGQGISQFGTATESFSDARAAVFEALRTILRKPGAEQEIIFKNVDGDTDQIHSSTHAQSEKSETKLHESVALSTAEVGKNFLVGLDQTDGKMKPIKAILPKYEIDSSSSKGLKPDNVSGVISFQNVQFSYPTRPNDHVLQGLSLEIHAGQVVAFVGPSGGGKSTVVSMIERFYDPTAGSIFLDGVNIRDINVTYLRSLIGYVGQEPALFATTVRDNIRYGNRNATDEQIEEAAKLANAHDFITSFTDGYLTQVGDKGTQLSGGQKQRIAIARVLVGNPKILLLDEATSALDAESELVVQDALDNILNSKKITTILIAHRLSTIRNADVINVIVSGKLVEQGSHEELMKTETYYKKLVDKQEGVGSGSDLSPDSPPRSRSSRANSSTDLQIMDSVVLKMGEEGAVGNSVPHIAFRDITFSYPTRPRKTVLNKFNLIVKQGETVALVGTSGGGKSTTVGLIERFYDPNEGTLEYLGHDVRTLNVSWYRGQIGYVGQEPTLFNDTIARNVAFGVEGVTQEEIEDACRQANAHDFITEFADGYETQLGEKTALSGGQKQRIAIARALVRKPKVLLLDEATSALDNQSEAIVQDAIDKLMASHKHTVIMIAHRLSTVRDADKIALISDGHVVEYGPHHELMQNHNGRYKQLNESAMRVTKVDKVKLKERLSSIRQQDNEEDDGQDLENKDEVELLDQAYISRRVRQLARPDILFMLAGLVGATVAGFVFPVWGVLFSKMIDLLFRRVVYCGPGQIPTGFTSCQAYWNNVADSMQHESFILAIYWAILSVGSVLGNVLMYWGFGMASERLNKRVRDETFSSLLRQEVAFFDKNTVGTITSQLQDDAARLHAFSGEPLRTFSAAAASVITGVVLSFFYMWPMALVAIGCIPFMAFAASIRVKQMMGSDQGTDNADESANSPGGMIVETLLNMRTVSSLTLEEQRYAEYMNALKKSKPNIAMEGVMAGVTFGLSTFLQQWINALQLWFGGYMLFTYPHQYSFSDFLIANFAILFSLYGLGTAFQDISDRTEVKHSVGRIFSLLDRKSVIDPLSSEGKKLD